jgi:hypothetical protein
MGRAIYYCVQCSKRVSDTDIETGKAFKVGDRILCKACAPASAKSQTSKKVPAVTRSRNSGTSTALKNVTAPIPAPPPPPGDGRKRLLLGAGAGGALALIVLILILRSGGKPGAPPAKEEPPVAQPAPVDPREASSKADLDKARAFVKSHPEDLTGRLREFTDIVWKWEGTEAAREAAKEAAATKALILAKVEGWMAELEAQIKELVEKRQFRAAAKKIEELKPAHELAEWRLAAEKRASELYVLGRKAAEAEEAATLKKTEEKPAPGVEEKPVAKALSEEAKGYLAKWEAALAKATARDYAGAIAELERFAGSLKDDGVKGEAAEDVALLKGSAAAWTQAMEFLRQRTRGGGLSVAYRDGSATPKRAGGTVLQIDADRVEILTGKSTVFVDWGDVTAATLADLAQRKQPEPRALAALCLLEGEVEDARRFKADLAPKWWTYGESARARLPKPDPAEKNARDLFASAENGWRSMEKRAAAVEAYRTLRTDFTSTAVVKAYTERIFRRSDGGKEYYFGPADFQVDGTIRLAKNGKLESTKDSDLPDTLRNFAELEFAALPGQTYRCWLLVGACCEETFAFFYQGTELTDVEAKTKKKVACDPGTGFAVFVKHSLRNLKKTHDEHKIKGAKTHPKTAARWEWIEIPLPKYAAPGAKKLRFMTNQAGFSIGGAAISATRKAAPAEAEIKDLEKARAVDEPPLPVDADLVGWWAFDEGAGTAAVDLSGKGHGGTFVGDVRWTEGKIGGGVQVTGAKSGVEVASADDLKIAGDLTMALWVLRTAETGDWVCVLGRGTKDQRNYGLWLEAGNRKYMFQQYGGQYNINVYGKSLLTDGQWTHLAVTIQQDVVRVYFNGALDGEEKRPGPPALPEAPLGIGLACFHSALVGSVDDARIYRRALSAEEVKALVDMGR